MKNKFFTNELVRFANIVLTPKFAGVGSMEDLDEKRNLLRGRGR